MCYRKIISSALSAGIMASIVFGIFTSASAKEALVVKSEEGNVLEVVPVLDQTVILFDEDNIIFKIGEWQTSLSTSDVDCFSHEETYLSPFEVRVASGDSAPYPLEGKYVTLHNEHSGDLFGVVQLTDTEGKALFKYLPAGFYTVFVNDPDDIFEPCIRGNIRHGNNDWLETIMKENTLVPGVITLHK